ncbi:secreted protein [Nocardioidaceae bacterium Broad-1]|nr:secreted protein [Nocardioidaceae bacterium Broad-1]
MKVVVIGGSGLIGSNVVKLLGEHGHEAVSASPESGCNTLTGEGLKEVMEGADVVVDVSNSPSFADDDVMAFFITSTKNLIEAEKVAGVKHHVALSVVGCDRAPDSGYLRAKVAQEQLIKESGVPYSIVRATQFFEFGPRIADSATIGDEVHLPPVSFQPIAARDVAAVVGRTSVGTPLNGLKEIAGPEAFRFDEYIAGGLKRIGDPRRVVADPQAPYFGQVLTEKSIVPLNGAETGPTSYAEWVAAASTER